MESSGQWHKQVPKAMIFCQTSIVNMKGLVIDDYKSHKEAETDDASDTGFEIYTIAKRHGNFHVH